MRPYPKSKRVEDLRLVKKIRSRGYCTLMGLGFGFCSDGLDVHHIKSRGSGGGDVEGNLILLCRRHHQLAHMGKIKKKELEEICLI